MGKKRVIILSLVICLSICLVQAQLSDAIFNTTSTTNSSTTDSSTTTSTTNSTSRAEIETKLDAITQDIYDIIYSNEVNDSGTSSGYVPLDDENNPYTTGVRERLRRSGLGSSYAKLRRQQMAAEHIRRSFQRDMDSTDDENARAALIEKYSEIVDAQESQLTEDIGEYGTTINELKTQEDNFHTFLGRSRAKYSTIVDSIESKYGSSGSNSTSTSSGINPISSGINPTNSTSTNTQNSSEGGANFDVSNMLSGFIQSEHIKQLRGEKRTEHFGAKLPDIDENLNLMESAKYFTSLTPQIIKREELNTQITKLQTLNSQLEALQSSLTSSSSSGGSVSSSDLVSISENLKEIGIHNPDGTAFSNEQLSKIDSTEASAMSKMVAREIERLLRVNSEILNAEDIESAIQDASSQ